MVIQGRRFGQGSSPPAAIHCQEWIRDAIDPKDTDATRFGEDTMRKLRLVEAGITRRDVEEARASLVARVSDAVFLYVKSGSPSAKQQKGGARQGVSESYRPTCATGISYATAAEMREGYNRTRLDCMMDVLEWSYYPGARGSPSLFEQGNYLSSRGARGVSPRCYSLDESTRSFQDVFRSQADFPDGYPMSLIRDYALGKLSSSSPIGAHVRRNSFSAGNTSGGGNGVLLWEYMPPPPPSTPQSVASRAQAMQGATGSFEHYSSTQLFDPCIELRDVEARLPRCREDAAGEEDLKPEHCRQAYVKGYDMVVEFSKPRTGRVLMQGVERCWAPFTGTRLCETSKEVVREVHPGLNETIKASIIELLKRRRDDCIAQSKEFRVCYDHASPSAAIEAEERVILSDMEAVLAGGGSSKGAAAEAALQYSERMGYLQKKCWYEGGQQVCGRSYATTGSRLVDSAMQRIYWADPSYTEYRQGRQGFRNLSDSLLLDAIVGPLFSFMVKCNQERLTDRCLPDDRYITLEHHFVKIYPEHARKQEGFVPKACFRVYKPTGLFGCRFDAGSETGLDREIAEARSIARSRLPIRSPVTGATTPWAPLPESMLAVGSGGVGQPQYPLGDLNRLLYTLYVRMADSIVADGAASRAYAMPRQLPFHRDARNYARGFESFNLASRLQHERNVERDNHNCDGVNVTVIQYGQCSDNYIGLYRRAGDDLRNLILKEGPTFVPPRSVLVWPGVPLSQHLGVSVPAWSRSPRNSSEVFAQWALNASAQCPQGDAENSVCTKVVPPETSCQNVYSPNAPEGACYPAIGERVAVNPWLGGHFNPWERCDTSSSPVVDGGAGMLNEKIDVACHPMVCDDQHPEYLARMPNREGCTGRNGKLVGQANLDPRSANNLCRREPPQHSSDGSCQWEQGQALRGARGVHVGVSLYAERDVNPPNQRLAEGGQGLFAYGGNPLYHTTSVDSTFEGAHAVIRQSLEDIGGHHVVFRVASDPITQASPTLFFFFRVDSVTSIRFFEKVSSEFSSPWRRGG